MAEKIHIWMDWGQLQSTVSPQVIWHPVKWINSEAMQGKPVTGEESSSMNAEKRNKIKHMMNGVDSISTIFLTILSVGRKHTLENLWKENTTLALIRKVSLKVWLMITEQWKDRRTGKDFSVITAKTTSCCSFPWRIGFHRVPSSTNHNSYKSNPDLFSTKKGKRAEGREGHRFQHFQGIFHEIYPV